MLDDLHRPSASSVPCAANQPSIASRSPRSCWRSPRSLIERDATSSASTSTRCSSSTAAPSRSMRSSRSRREAADRARTVPCPVRAARSPRRGRLEPSGEVRVRGAPQHPDAGLRGRGLRHEPRRGRGPGCPDVAERRRAPGRRSGRPRVRVHACERQRRSVACVRGAWRRRGVLDLRRLRRSGGRKVAAPRPTSSRSRTRSASSWRGPNGQGIVSTPVGLCAQIVAPYPPRGAIGIASQSGNFVSSFQNYARASGVGVSRAVSAGNAAALTRAGLSRVLRGRSRDARRPGVRRGRSPTVAGSSSGCRAVTADEATGAAQGRRDRGGQRAAASHTGALASDDRVFDGMCRQAGITRAATVEEAFDTAATFATQPLPRGPRVAVVTTAGGWGVVTADAITAIGARAPGRSRTRCAPRSTSSFRPVGVATTRSTSPAARPGTRSRRCSSSSRATPTSTPSCTSGSGSSRTRPRDSCAKAASATRPGLERIVAYHERQDARFAARCRRGLGRDRASPC